MSSLSRGVAPATLVSIFRFRRLIGSFAKPEAYFDPNSDIDLLVEHSAGRSDLEIWRIARERVKEVEVDVVMAETLDAEILKFMKSGVDAAAAMTKTFDSIKQGLQEAIAHAYGHGRVVRVHRPRPVDVRAQRAKVGMTQEEFAAKFGFATATLRHWERGDRKPHGASLVLLNVIERNPRAVIEALTA